MRTCTVLRSVLNIPSDATVVLYECDRYGNKLNLSYATLTGESLTLSFNTTTQSIKDSVRGKTLALFSYYMLELTSGKATHKIPLYPFDGVGMLDINDILTPKAFHAVYSLVHYEHESTPLFVLEDFITHLEAWLQSGCTLYDARYHDAFLLVSQYGSYACDNTPTYMNTPCLKDMDMFLSTL